MPAAKNIPNRAESKSRPQWLRGDGNGQRVWLLMMGEIVGRLQPAISSRDSIRQQAGSHRDAACSGVPPGGRSSGLRIIHEVRDPRIGHRAVGLARKVRAPTHEVG